MFLALHANIHATHPDNMFRGWSLCLTHPLNSITLDGARNRILVSVSVIKFFLSHWGHWVMCQQLFLARLDRLCQCYWYLALCSPDNDSSVGHSPWWWSVLMLSLQLVPSWLEARALQARQEQRCLVLVLSSGCQDAGCLLFSSKPPLLPPLSLLFPSHRAITGVHASTASVCQHDHVSEEGTLRRHGVRCGRTRRHHRSQWWRGGLLLMHTSAPSRDLPSILSLYMCVCREPSHPFTPVNLSSSIWCFFFCSIKPEWRPALISKPF